MLPQPHRVFQQIFCFKGTVTNLNFCAKKQNCYDTYRRFGFHNFGLELTIVAVNPSQSCSNFHGKNFVGFCGKIRHKRHVEIYLSPDQRSRQQKIGADRFASKNDYSHGQSNSNEVSIFLNHFKKIRNSWKFGVSKNKKLKCGTFGCCCNFTSDWPRLLYELFCFSSEITGQFSFPFMVN